MTKPMQAAVRLLGTLDVPFASAGVLFFRPPQVVPNNLLNGHSVHKDFLASPAQNGSLPDTLFFSHLSLLPAVKCVTTSFCLSP